LFYRVIRDATILVKPVTKGSKTGIEFSFTVTASQAVEIGGDALSGDGIVHKTI
jgi:hypothetical protein